MTTEIERFVADVQKDAALNDAIAAKHDDIDGMISIAASRGYKFSRADVDAYSAGRKSELSDKQLDGIAGGGKHNNHNRNGFPWFGMVKER